MLPRIAVRAGRARQPPRRQASSSRLHEQAATARSAWRPARRQASTSDPLLRLHEQMAASMNATARLLGVSHRVHISSAEAPAPTPPTAATPPPQKHAKRALRYMSDAEIAAYVSEVADTIQFEGSMMPGVEALVYGHCVKIVLSLVHEALDALPAFGVLGLRLDVAPQKRRGLDLVEALRRRRGEDDAHGKVRVDEERVRAFVDRVLEVEREASGGGAIGDFERSLHHNVCAVVVNLAADVASTIRLGCFGHDLTLDVRPIAAWLDTLTTEELRRRRRAGLPQLFGEAHVDALLDGVAVQFSDPATWSARPRRRREALVDEILGDESVNLSYVPDVVESSVERTFYRRVFGFYSVVMDYVLADVSLSVLDVDMDVALRRDPE